MTSAELIPAVILKRKAVVYVRQSTRAAGEDAGCRSVQGQPGRAADIGSVRLHLAP
jgi:hypothetical protein